MVPAFADKTVVIDRAEEIRIDANPEYDEVDVFTARLLWNPTMHPPNPLRSPKCQETPIEMHERTGLGTVYVLKGSNNS